MKFSAALLTLALATPLRAQVLNDWTIPCTQGVCSWNLPAESGTEGWIQIVSCSTYTNRVAVLYPSLTLFIYAYIVGLSWFDFRHYSCMWLDNFNNMRPD